jgi:hypothetical protein
MAPENWADNQGVKNKQATKRQRARATSTSSSDSLTNLGQNLSPFRRLSRDFDMLVAYCAMLIRGCGSGIGRAERSLVGVG